MSRWIATFLAGSLALLTAFVGTAQAQNSYRLNTGDSLRLEVLEDPTLNRTLLIAPDGRVAVPLAGGIKASGRSLEAVQAEVAAKLASNFATTPTVYLALERRADLRPSTGTTGKGIEIFVMGEANKPGKLEISPGTTMLQALAQMGGFSKFAATKRIQLRRGTQNSTFNYNAIEAGTSTAGSVVLKDGDVIVIPQRKLFE